MSTAKRKEPKGITIGDSIEVPSSIFRDRRACVLESVVYYLKETKGLTFHQIAVLLNRDDRTIWTAYTRTVKKRRRR
ncbi:MAG: hypothetical protein ABIH41_02935 [Nanoarchaeota archaeon]